MIGYCVCYKRLAYRPPSQEAIPLDIQKILTQISPLHSTRMLKIWATLHPDKRDLSVLEILVQKAHFVLSHRKLGASIFLNLFKPENFLATDQIEDLNICIQILLSLGSSFAVTGFICNFLKTGKGIRNLSFGLDRFLSEQTSKRFTPRAVADICKDFKSDRLERRLSDEEIEVLGQQTAQILYSATKVRKSSDLELRNQLISLREGSPKVDLRLPRNRIQLLTFLAVASELHRREYGFSPHGVQLMTVLALLQYPEECRGRFAQMKTGEGKSCVIALLAAVLGFSGRQVRIGTSTQYLAGREAEKFSRFFLAFSLDSGHLSQDLQINLNTNMIKKAILYGQPSDYQFIYLSKRLSGETVFLGNDLILDEADVVFVDRSGSHARVGGGVLGFETSILDSIYEFGITVVDSQLITLEAIKKVLKEKFPFQDLEKLRDNRLKRYVEAAKDALFQDKEGQDYTISDGKIVIVEHAETGEFLDQSRWQYGRHYFLERRHGLHVNDETQTLAALSPVTLLKMFEGLYCVSGTIGTGVEREELRIVHDIDTFDVPEYLPCLREEYARILCRTTSAYYQTIVDEARDLAAKGRAVLVLVPTILASESMVSQFELAGLAPACLNAVKGNETNFIVASAGESGKITVATNIAGRGTDIIPDEETLVAGGVHVIFGSFPYHWRAFVQGIGRGARQGAPGSYRWVIGPDDAVFSEGLSNILSVFPGDDTIIWTLLMNQLQERVAALSRHRQNFVKYESKRQEYLERFFAFLADGLGDRVTRIKTEWAYTYEEIQDLETDDFQVFSREIEWLYQNFLRGLKV